MGHRNLHQRGQNIRDRGRKCPVKYKTASAASGKAALKRDLSYSTPRAVTLGSILVGLLLMVFLTDCSLFQPRLSIGKELDRRIVRTYSESQDLTVLFATNRKTTEATRGCDDGYFTVEPGDTLHFGVCEVNVPRNHSVGALDKTDNIAQLNANIHFLIRGHTPITEAEFFDRLDKLPGNEVLLFVHGFNVKFQEAVHRAAQIAYDSKFQGPVILFTWPAGPADGFISSFRMDKTYADNLQAARGSVEFMMAFLERLTKGDKKLHIMVHSMGHQVVLPALVRLVSQKGYGKFIDELVLNAPDFSAVEFATVVDSLRHAARRITLYCSPNDNALKASEQVNSGRRIGQCEPVEGIDVINVMEVDTPTLGIGGLGHGYYSGRAILTDLFQLLLGIDAERRLFIRKTDPGTAEQYRLRK